MFRLSLGSAGVLFPAAKYDALSVEQTADGVNAKRNQIQPANRGAGIDCASTVQQQPIAQRRCRRGGFIAPIELHVL